MTLDRPRPRTPGRAAIAALPSGQRGQSLSCAPMPLKLLIPFCTSWQWPRHTVCSWEAMEMTVYERNGERGIQEVSAAWATASAVTTLGALRDIGKI